MASVYKNLRYCEIYHGGEYYDVMIAVDDLDEVNDILQDWATDTLGESLDLPEDLVQNYNAKEINLKTKNINNFVYISSGA